MIAQIITFRSWHALNFFAFFSNSYFYKRKLTVSSLTEIMICRFPLKTGFFLNILPSNIWTLFLIIEPSEPINQSGVKKLISPDTRCFCIAWQTVKTSFPVSIKKRQSVLMQILKCKTDETQSITKVSTEFSHKYVRFKQNSCFTVMNDRSSSWDKEMDKH